MGVSRRRRLDPSMNVALDDGADHRTIYCNDPLTNSVSKFTVYNNDPTLGVLLLLGSAFGVS